LTPITKTCNCTNSTKFLTLCSLGYDTSLFNGYAAQKAFLLASYTSNVSAILEVFFNGNPTTTLVLQKPLSRGTVILNLTDAFAAPARSSTLSL